MTSIRPSMPGIQQTGPMQNVQRAQPQAKPAEAKAPPPPPKETSAMAKDENKTKTFDDTPMEDVSLKFEGESKAAEATQEIEALFETEAPEGEAEVESAGETEEAEAPEGEGEVDEAGETGEAPEVEEEEEEEAGEAGDYEESEGGGGEAEQKVNVAPLLELVAQLRDIPKFRIEETWQAYGG